MIVTASNADECLGKLKKEGIELIEKIRKDKKLSSTVVEFTKKELEEAGVSDNIVLMALKMVKKMLG